MNLTISKSDKSIQFSSYTSLSMEIGFLVGSLCTIAGYFIIKEELRAYNLNE